MNNRKWTGLSARDIVFVIISESREPLKTSRELARGLLENIFGEINDDQRRALEVILNRTERVMDLLASLQEGEIPD